MSASDFMKALGRETRIIIEDAIRPLALQITDLKAENEDLKRELFEVKSARPQPVKGDAGRGISTCVKNEDGELIVILTDGEEINVGNVKGSDGDDGKDASVEVMKEVLAALREKSSMSAEDLKALIPDAVQGDKGDKGDAGDPRVLLDELKAYIDEKVADLPKPEKGRDAPTLEEIVTETLKHIRQPEDGRNAPTIEEIVEALKEHIPDPVKGDKGDDAPSLEEIVAAVRPHLPDAVKGDKGDTPAMEDIIEAIKPHLPPGKKGDKGDSPSIDEIVEAVRPHLEKGDKGDKGDDAPSIDVIVEAVKPFIPKAIKGDKGDDAPALEEIVEAVKPHLPKAEAPTVNYEAIHLKAVEALTADLPKVIERSVKANMPEAKPGPRGLGYGTPYIDRDKNLCIPRDDGEVFNLGRIVGEDGAAGLGIDDVKTEYDGERGFTIRMGTGDKLKEWSFKLPIPIYRGPWTAATEKAEQGDCYTYGGETWYALEDTVESPGSEEKAWRLMSKRGKPGAPGKPGDKGDKGDTVKGRDAPSMAEILGELAKLNANPTSRG